MHTRYLNSSPSMEQKGRSARKERKIRHCPPPPDEFPWLVFFHSANIRKQTFYSISKKSHCVRSIPELQGKRIHNSCHGWLILSTYELKNFSLFNPITFESINLPPPKLDPTSNRYTINACVLSLPPCHPDSTIFIFNRQSRSISYCRIKKQCWFIHCYSEEIGVLCDCANVDNIYLHSPISCNGKAYAVTSPQHDDLFEKEYLLSINMTEQDSIVLQCLVKFPSPRKEILFSTRSDLLEADGVILSIKTSYELKSEEHDLVVPDKVIDVEIHKLDLSSMYWERVVNAKNRAFFLDNRLHQGSCSVSCSEALGNCVYFLQHLGDDWLCSYHLEDCTVSTSVPCPNLPWHMVPVWVLPDRPALVFEKDQLGEKDSTTERENVDHETEKEETKASGTQSLNLCFDVLEDIHDRLTLLDYMSFRSVSKLCREVAPPLDLKGAILRSEIQCNSMSPWLMSAHENSSVSRFTHPQICEKYSVTIPEPLQDASIWYCKDGWLLIGKERYEVFCLSFLNPFNKEVIPYPELKDTSACLTAIAFSCPPTSENCVVVVLEALHSRVHICHSRTIGWRFFEFEMGGNFFITYNYPVFANGAFYFLGSEGNLGVFRLQNESSRWDILEQPQKLDASYSDCFLAERDGEVFVVLTYEMGKRVSVLKLDHSTLNWNSVSSFGNCNLHVSKSSALFTVSQTSGTGNKIYFPRFQGGQLVSYSLESSRFENFLKNYDGTKEPTVCCWIKPSRS